MENKKLQIIGFGDVPENGMIGGLLTGFDLTKSHSGIGGSIVKHLLEVDFGHEMGAGAGGKIGAPFHELHGAAVDLSVPLDGVLQGISAFGECRGIQDHKIIIEGFFVVGISLGIVVSVLT